jgi:hypothetical protein
MSDDKTPRSEEHDVIKPLQEGGRGNSSALENGQSLLDIDGGATFRVDVLRDRLSLSKDAGRRLEGAPARRG